MRKLALVLLLAVALPGCGTSLSVLPTVIAAVTDAALILDQIEAFVRSYFVAHPDQDRLAHVEKAIGKCRSTLIFAQRAAQGAEKLDQQKVDEAFADFKVAYSELAALLDGVPGLMVAKNGDHLTAPRGELVIPAPEALTIKAVAR